MTIVSVCLKPVRDRWRRKISDAAIARSVTAPKIFTTFSRASNSSSCENEVIGTLPTRELVNKLFRRDPLMHTYNLAKYTTSLSVSYIRTVKTTNSPAIDRNCPNVRAAWLRLAHSVCA